MISLRSRKCRTLDIASKSSRGTTKLNPKGFQRQTCLKHSYHSSSSQSQSFRKPATHFVSPQTNTTLWKNGSSYSKSLSTLDRPFSTNKQKATLTSIKSFSPKTYGLTYKSPTTNFPTINTSIFSHQFHNSVALSNQLRPGPAAMHILQGEQISLQDAISLIRGTGPKGRVTKGICR